MRASRAIPPILLATLWLAHPSAAARAQAPGAPAGSSWIEAGGFYQPVTKGFGDWKGGYARAVIAGPSNVWYLETKAQEAFHDQGFYASLANVHTFSDRLYTHVSVGGGSGEYVLPDLRADGSISLKLGTSRALVATVGVTLVDAKAGFSDKAAFGSLTWYAQPRLLIEIGARFNSSNPGAVGSGRGTAAFTLGRQGQRLVSLRGSAGTEGYQLTGVASALRRFSSQEAGIAWREWIGLRWGSVLGAEWYHNPFYSRTGLTIGVFRAW